MAEPIKKLQKPLPAEESIKHFITPVGFTVELFAADPEIGKPLSMNWDMSASATAPSPGAFSRTPPAPGVMLRCS